MVLRVLSLTVSLIVLFSACATAQPPLPMDLKVTPPASDVPKSIAAFSGKWVGVWGGHLDHILVVEKIEGRSVSLVYSWGVAPMWRIYNPAFQRVTGTIGEDGLLRATLANGAEVVYKLASDQQSVSGEYTLRGTTTMGVFKRQP